jgi:hypothetical protein
MAENANITEAKILKRTPPILMGISLKCWIQNLLNAGASLSNLPFVIMVTLVIIFLSPLRLYESLRLRKILPKVKITHPPVFIIGCPRSGTTHLHNILSQHTDFGFISTPEASGFPYSHLISTPDTFLHKKLKHFKMKRNMDNMLVSADLPQEEEFAMGTISPYSFMMGIFFKNHLKWCIDNTLLANNPNKKAINRWKKDYSYVLKKITFLRQGKPLLLKNPFNTARIKWLLELYPDAKFIHIYRNPYDVFPSLMNLFIKSGKETHSHHKTSELEKNVFKLYTILLQGYFEQQKLIPPQNLVEVKYEDLEKNSLEEITRLYNQLNITCTKENIDAITKYINHQKNYEKNKFSLDYEKIKTIYQHWHFTIDKWGYLPPKVN